MRWERDTTGRTLYPGYPTLVITGAFAFVMAIPQFMFGGADAQHQAVNGVLYLAVGFVWLVWVFLYRIGYCSEGSASGLGVAAHAVVLRLAGELGVWYVEWLRHAGSFDAPEAFVASFVQWSRPLGVAGVVFGLAMVVLGVVSDRWAARHLGRPPA